MLAIEKTILGYLLFKLLKGNADCLGSVFVVLRDVHSNSTRLPWPFNTNLEVIYCPVCVYVLFEEIASYMM